VFLSTTCGYGLHRLAGKGCARLSNSILMMRMVPTMVLTIPFYLLFRQLNLINSLGALALCYSALSMPLAIWLSLGFYRNIPDSIYEAAMVDGCTEWSLFSRIALPLAMGSIVVVVLNVFFFAWNEFSLAMVLVNKEQYRTMAADPYFSLVR
jgi:ABC-type glycerol-3-phosphate transport system permease component